jgi:hypothetical protein
MPSKRTITQPTVVAAAVAGLLVASSTAVVMNKQANGGPAPGIERAEANDLLSRAVRLARAGDFAGLCQSVGAAAGPCRSILDYAMSEGWLPGNSIPTVTGVRRYPDSGHGQETLVLHVAGVRSDGSHYETDFPIVRIATGEVRSTGPVYWSGMIFDGSSAVCDQKAAEVCAQDEVSPPRLGPFVR